MRFILDALYLLAGAAISPMVIYRAFRHKRYRTGWAERFGKIARKNPTKKCIWLHAVSVGEVNASKTIITELESRFPHFEIMITTTTDTGFGRAAALFGERLQVVYFPFDLSCIMRRAFGRIRPTLCLLMELEVWPNFVATANQLHVPVIVINGRISDKGFAGYSRIKSFARSFFRKVDLVLAQTDEYARRFIELGCPKERVIVTGSLKYDTAHITDRVEGACTLAAQLNITGERLWVAGATGDGEEQIILNVYSRLIEQKEFADLRLAIVPRKPERFDEVAQLIEQSGFNLIRYSELKTAAPDAGVKSKIENRKLKIDAVVLGDTMGDLRKFYSLASVIFVGRSLVPMGGSDMMEAAALGKCTIFGPHAFNFKQAVEALLKENGAIMVKNEHELLQIMKKCLLEPDFARKIAANGQEVIRKNQGATAKTIEQISRFLTAS